jgi:hypothetical protein
VTPLRAVLPKIETNEKILAGLDPSPARDCCLLLLKLTGSATTLMGRILLHAKDQGRDGGELDVVLSSGRDLLEIAQAIIDKTRGDLPTLDSLVTLDKLVIGSLELFSSLVSPSAPEAKDLRDQIALLRQGAASLETTIQRAIEQSTTKAKPAAPKPRPAAADGERRAPSKTASLVNSKESQERLMTRLGLESRVNMWRWRLEFFEKELAAITA